MTDDHQASAPFEGPEKLLEIWFAPSANAVPVLPETTPQKTGLRTVPRAVWEEMLDIVKCKVLSVVEGDEIDAYLLSESSFFVSPHRLILKTCGTTLNLLGLPRILEIAAQHARLTAVYRFFYSRKSFMFPERQSGPHRDWKQEVEYLDRIFATGAAYTVGKVNGDHWLLYITGAEPMAAAHHYQNHHVQHYANGHANGHAHHHHVVVQEAEDRHPDYTIEILMSDLSAKARQPFFFDNSDTDSDNAPTTPALQAAALSEALGITEIFPPALTQLDAYAFDPCGYSSNALIRWGHESLADGAINTPPATTNGTDTDTGARAHAGEGYYTIHVTPEEGWSYASFECNVPLSTADTGSALNTTTSAKIPDLKTLIKRVVRIFEPGRITLTLFISSADNEAGGGAAPDDSAVEAAQRAFRAALAETPIAFAETNGHCAGETTSGNGAVNGNGVVVNGSGAVNGNGNSNGASNGKVRTYKRTDKINYEFGGYDLAFASFELR